MSSTPPYATTLTSPRFLSDDEMKTRLHRFLVDSVAFAYQANHDELVKVLPSHLRPRTHEPETDNPPIPRSTILSADERKDMLCLADLVCDVSDKVSWEQIGLITAAEREVIIRRILLPALQLNVAEGYVLKLLRLYSTHKGIDHRESGLYTWRFFFGWSVVADADFEKRLVSDDLLIRSVSTNESMRQVLGNALAAFGDKYLRVKGDSAYSSGNYWVDADSSALLEVMNPCNMWQIISKYGR